jgi:hypothetical protein
MSRNQARVLRLWRDYDQDAVRLPGMALGSAELAEDAAAAAREQFDAGVRKVEFVAVADLRHDADQLAAVRILTMVRELTARGIAVDWRVRCDRARAADWRSFSHLFPPKAIDGPPGAESRRSAWAESFFLGRCQMRKGPGFLEIRDHRQDVLNRLILDDPAYIDAAVALRDDPAAEVPPDILADLRAESLALAFGPLNWWAPCTTHRWPHPPFSV